MTLIGAGIDFSRDQHYATPGIVWFLMVMYINVTCVTCCTLPLLARIDLTYFYSLTDFPTVALVISCEGLNIRTLKYPHGRFRLHFFGFISPKPFNGLSKYLMHGGLWNNGCLAQLSCWTCTYFIRPPSIFFVTVLQDMMMHIRRAQRKSNRCLGDMASEVSNATTNCDSVYN